MLTILTCLKYNHKPRKRHILSCFVSGQFDENMKFTLSKLKLKYILSTWPSSIMYFKLVIKTQSNIGLANMIP